MRRATLATLAWVGLAALVVGPARAQEHGRGQAPVDRTDVAYKDALQDAQLSPQAEEWVNQAIRGFSAARMRAGFAKRAELEESAIVDAFEEQVMPRLALEGITPETRAYMLGAIMDRLTLARERLAVLDEAQGRFKTAVTRCLSDPAAQGTLIYAALDRLQGAAPSLWRDAAAEPGAAKGAADLDEDDEPWMPPALPGLVASELSDLYSEAGVPEDGAKREALDEAAARLTQATADWLAVTIQG